MPGIRAATSAESTGHIDDRHDDLRSAAAQRFAKITAWEDCNDCAFIPVCAGGCSAAAHTELGDMNKPNCHKPSFEAGVVTLARTGGAGDGARLANVSTSKQGLEFRDERSTNVNGKKDTKKKGTLRPWLVDVSLDHLR